MPNAPRDERPLHRIAKLLARAGIASRREVERMIAEGRVAKDGVVLDTAATVLPSLHGVTVDGAPVAAPEPTRLFLFHKPPGLLTTERDPRGRPTIYDRLPKDLPRLMPVGRLDLNTEGLLLLTTDGEFKRQLELPATGVERVYRARAYGRISQPQLESLIDGIEIDGIRYGPIDANMERRTGANQWIELALREGKNREVRRVLEYLGLEVSRLIRTRYGPFVLGDLQPGEVGEVRAADIARFRQALAKGRPVEERVAVAGGGARPARRERVAAPEAAAPPPEASRPSRAATPAREPGRRPAADGALPRTAPRPRGREPARDRQQRRPGADAGERPPSRDPGARPAPAPRGTTRLQDDGRGRGRPERHAPPPPEGGERRLPHGSTARPTPTAGGATRPQAGGPARSRPGRSGNPRAPDGASAKPDTGETTAGGRRPPRPPVRKAGWAKPKPPSRPGRKK